MTIITFITLAMQQALPLSDFAPLIQLWAGICLLFYYEKEILNESPLEKFQQKISDQFDNKCSPTWNLTYKMNAPNVFKQ